VRAPDTLWSKTKPLLYIFNPCYCQFFENHELATRIGSCHLCSQCLPGCQPASADRSTSWNGQPRVCLATSKFNAHRDVDRHRRTDLPPAVVAMLLWRYNSCVYVHNIFKSVYSGVTSARGVIYIHLYVNVYIHMCVNVYMHLCPHILFSLTQTRRRTNI